MGCFNESQEQGITDLCPISKLNVAQLSKRQ